MTDMEIRYDHGCMVIHLDAFMGMRNISKFKKMLNIIRDFRLHEFGVDDEDYEVQRERHEGELWEYIHFFNDHFEERQQNLNAMGTGYLQKISFSEKQIKDTTVLRDKCPRSTAKKKNPAWDRFNDELKQHREELKNLKTMFRDVQRDLNNLEKDRAFLEKCSEVLMQG